MGTDENSGPQPGRGADDRPQSKVARLIAEYDIDPAFGDRLEALWTADEDREGLRALADRFNKRLLERAVADAEMSMLDGEVTNLYRLLTDDDVTSGERAEARARIEQQGVDADALERDFVTYQAVRSYLQDYRGAVYDPDETASRVDNAVGTIQRLEARTRSVVEKNLSQLRQSDRLELGEFRLFVDVNVLCEDCGTQYGVVELLRRGHCDCTAEATETD